MIDQNTCPLCQTNQKKIFEKVTSFNIPLVYYQCSNCGLVHQTNPDVSNTSFYQESYRKVYQADEAPTTKDLLIQKQRAQDQAARLKRLGIKSAPRILDIGASAGILLETLSSYYSAYTLGVEPGNSYRQFALDKDINMVSSLQDLLDSKPELFDLITLMHVLEHLPNPVEILKTLRESLLTKNGYLLIEVPNFFAHDSYELAHITCYTPHSLREMLKISGFRIIHQEKHGFPRSKILNLYLSILATPAEILSANAVLPEKGVKEKRKISMLYRRIVQKIFPNMAWLPITAE